MAKASRYNVNGDEADITTNKLGLKALKELEDAETVLLIDAYEYFINLIDQTPLKINIELLFKIHNQFLGTLYTWAGKIRTVNISKGDVMFAPARNIEKSLNNFEKQLPKILPSHNDTETEIALKLATIYSELNIIHPFREGNGRTLRLFIDIILMQIGYEALDFNKVDQREYINACAHGTHMNYKPLQQIFLGLLIKNTQR